MRRSTRLGLIAIAALLIVVFGLYTVFWFIAADRLKEGVIAGAEQAREQKIDLTWRDIAVGGYPLSLRVDVTDLHMRDTAINPAVDLQAPTLSASTHPWAFRHWSVSALAGLTVALANGATSAGKITAQSATGAVSVPADSGATIWLSLQKASAEAAADPAAHAAADIVHAWLMFPAHPPRGHDDRNVAFAIDLHRLGIPQAPRPFTATVDDVGFGVTVMGPIPPGPPRQAAEAWRQAGGTAELDHLALAWSNLRAAGSGTLALDSDLQPTGAFSGTISGLDELMTGLVSAGSLRPNDARLARLALAMLAKPGPEGRPEIATSLRIQNGDVYLGPAKIGRAPRIGWE